MISQISKALLVTRCVTVCVAIFAANMLSAQPATTIPAGQPTAATTGQPATQDFTRRPTQLTGQAQTSGSASETVATEVAEPVLHHDLEIELDPENNFLRVTDALTLPPRYRGQLITFSLNANLTITANNLLVTPVNAGRSNTAVTVPTTVATQAEATVYQVQIPPSFNNALTLSYEGQINDLAEQGSAEYAQSFAETSGIISSEGVFLSRASLWVPLIDEDMLTFDMQVEFAASASSWTAVSQGFDAAGPSVNATNNWRMAHPTEEIYLIAADFEVYEQAAGEVTAQAFLRTPDSNLATRYLDATARYLALYEPLLGDYPYEKFALVENFWETGYGMPSFTLLGEQVIRFPFILTTSYPHEILHNWWGNGVYPDYDSGNWSEGLTAYLADHLFDEMDGTGHEYRKEMLARYKNYVAEGSDFPLSEFTARNSAATQAVGYGKTLMLWHMLRLRLGDELFLSGLREFYASYLFQRASYADIEALFSELSGEDLSGFFSQWVDRTGAPELSLNVEAVNGDRARIMFAQIQAGDAYDLTVPVALFYADQEEPEIYNINLTQKLEGVMAEDYSRLEAILVDPYFDIFRTLDREETPPTIGELFGAEIISFVLPASNRQEWRLLAETFAQGADYEILEASQLTQLPQDRSVWVLGQDNPFAEVVAEAVNSYGGGLTAQSMMLPETELAYTNRSSVLVGRHPANQELAVGWIHVDDMIAMPGMIEKLPHYGKYSFLSFTGAEPTNDTSGIWVSPDSPMQWVKPDSGAEISFERLPEIPALATLPPEYLPADLMEHVRELTGPQMQGRGLGSRGLRQAAAYLTEQFRAAGLQPLDGGFQQRWRQAVPDNGNIDLINIVGMIPGTDENFAHAPLVVGAHYDHLGMDETTGTAYPGADDNASGVSVLLEVAGKLARSFTPQRPIVFVAFTAEEAGLLGAQHFVESPPGGFDSSDMFAMINLDAVGRLQGQPLQVFASDSAYEWPFMAQGIGFTIGVRSTFPEQTIASSDHVAFLNAGVPAIHLFSGAHTDYHRVSDTADKLDVAGLSNVALWLEEAVVYMANRTDPLRVNLEGAEQVELSGNTDEREASLGTVPDFAYNGAGVRISGVVPGSAAAQVGLQEGDVLLQFDGQTVNDLQTYSNLLRASTPGQIIVIEIQRGDQTFEVQATLTAR